MSPKLTFQFFNYTNKEYHRSQFELHTSTNHGKILRNDPNDKASTSLEHLLATYAESFVAVIYFPLVTLTNVSWIGYSLRVGLQSANHFKHSTLASEVQ